MENIYSVFTLCGGKNLCARTETVFFPIADVSEGTVSIFMLKDKKHSENVINLTTNLKKKKIPAGLVGLTFSNSD